MKIISLMILLSLAAFGLAGCSDGGGANSTTGNTADSTARTTNSGNNAMNSSANTNQSNTVNSSTTNITGTSTDMNSFMTEAARAGMAEVEMARLAEKRAQNAEVKKFAQKMVQDHTNANTELKQLAAQKNVTLPTELNTLHKLTMDKLSSLSGAEFDKEFMKVQITDHEKAVNLFQGQADLGTDVDAKAWAAKTLPHLKEHLQTARDISGKL